MANKRAYALSDLALIRAEVGDTAYVDSLGATLVAVPASAGSADGTSSILSTVPDVDPILWMCPPTSLNGTPVSSVNTDASIVSSASSGASVLSVNKSGDTSDPFELSYLLRVSAESQLGADGASLATIASLVGPTAEVVTGTPTISAAGFGGARGIQFPFSPRGTMRQAIPSVFSPEKPFTLLVYSTLGTLGAVARYLAGFGNAGGTTRCVLFNGPDATWINAYWSIVSTSTDTPPQNQIQRIGGNLYQGRRMRNNERGLFGIAYDGTNWFAIWNGAKIALSAGYGYTARTAGAIAHDGYLYFNGSAYSGLNTYISNPMLREMALIDHCASDAEIAQYWRFVAAPTEKRVYCLGDSITWGSTATTDGTLGTLNGWPQQLQELNTGRVVTNWGKVADRSDQILQRLNSALRYFLPRNSSTNTCMLVGIGSNDLISTTDSAATIYARIVAVCAAASAYGCGKTLVQNVMASTSITGGRDTERIALNALIAAGAGVDFSAMSDIAALTVTKSDGLHPNDAGYATIAAQANTDLTALSI